MRLTVTVAAAYSIVTLMFTLSLFTLSLGN